MLSLPIDTSAIRIISLAAVEPVEYDGVVKTNADGVPRWSVAVALLTDGNPETVSLKFYAKTAPKLGEGVLLKVVGLTLLHWEMGDRSGVSLSADSVAPSAG